MKAGWVISVIDTTLKDQVYKMLMESREVINKKISILKDKYDSIEKNRFQIFVSSPYSEIDTLNNKLVSCEKKAGTSTKYLVDALGDVDAFLIRENSTNVIFKICEHQLPQLETFLKTLSINWSILTEVT